MLNIENLHAGYGQVEVLRALNISVAEGEVAAIIGPNGAGKSTLLNAISGLVDRYEGSVRFNDQDITRFSAPEIVDLGVIQVPEGRQLFGSLTVEENLTLGFHRLRRGADAKADRSTIFETIYEMFPILSERRRQLAATLSGGEQQMVAIGRAMMARPKVLLLDEPSLGLAPLIVERIFEVLGQLKEQGLTMLLVEQHADAALDLADRGYVLAVGSLVAEGPAGELKDDPRVRDSYLGTGAEQ